MAFLIGAFLTPADPFSQIGLAVPLLLLYELSIFSVQFSARKNQAEDGGEEAEEGDQADVEGTDDSDDQLALTSDDEPDAPQST